MRGKRFVILGMQRSGTTVTHVCLSGHPNVSMAADEVFAEPFFTRGLATFTGGKETFQDRKDGYGKLFNLITASKANGSTLAAGFKVAIGNTREAIDVANCLREYFEGTRIILVQRTDLAAQFGSLRRAILSGQWHAWEGERSRSDHRIELPPEEFEAYARDAVGALAQLRTLAESHELLEFNYERDIVPGDRYHLLFDFLGLPRVPVTWMKMEKVAPPPDEFIVNYQAMRALQARIEAPSRERVRDDAAARLAECAMAERPLFLGYRASAYLDQGRTEEAVRDFLLAVLKRSGGGFDLSLQGHLSGKFERLQERSEVIQAVDRLRAESGRYLHFRLTQAEARVADGRFAAVPGDMVDLLLGEPGPAGWDLQRTFDLLIDALRGMVDQEGAADALRRLAPRYAGHEGLLTLEALLARHVGHVEKALGLLKAALAANPDYRRARNLLRWWTEEGSARTG